jgi:hypothetical protein
LPMLTAVTRPVLFTVKTEVVELLQVTVEVRFWVEPSEYVPVAANCCVVPFAMLAGVVGVMVIPVKVAVEAAAVKLLVVPFTVTVIVVVPGATPVITPVLLMLITDAFEEL